VLPSNPVEDLLARDEIDFTPVDFSNAPLGFFRPKAVNIRPGRQVQTRQCPINEADPCISGKFQRLVYDLIGCSWHSMSPYPAAIEPQRRSYSKVFSGSRTAKVRFRAEHLTLPPTTSAPLGQI
jgi:hypothetical protein